MSIYDLKPQFQNLLRPLVIKLEQRGVTANQVTLTACTISVILGLILTALSGYHWLFILIPIWLFVRMALNAIDGMLAREFNQKSRLGGYLNEITDVLSDAALYLPFAFIHPFDALQIGLIIWLSALTEFCGVPRLVLNSWPQAIFPPRSPELWGLQVCTITPVVPATRASARKNTSL